MTTTYVNWGESRVKLTWEENTLLPQHNLITSVHGFCFQGDQLLLVDLKNRGWDFPGGHIDPEETPEECFKREALEEAYIEGECELLGYVIVDHCENLMWTEGSPYPEIGYQVFYKMNIAKLLPFEGRYESTRRIFIDPNDISDYYLNWNRLYQKIMDCAIQ